MLRPGRWVEVRSLEEILATLDERGCSDGLPFLPEMAPAIGRRFRVRQRADVTCVHPPVLPFPRLERTVTLDGLTCDGGSHGGCQLGCALFWREAWLRPVAGPTAAPGDRPMGATTAATAAAAGDIEPTAADELVTQIAGRVEIHPDGDPGRWTCQATELPRATRPGRPFWRPDVLATFVTHGTFGPTEIVGRAAGLAIRRARRLLPERVGTPPHAGADAAGGGGSAAPEPATGPFAPTDLVRVRSAADIAATLDAAGANHGLRFGGDMRGEVGSARRVACRVERVIDERTGRLRTVRDTVILDGSVCDRYLGCARAMPFLWRDAWLEAVPAEKAPIPQRAALRDRRGVVGRFARGRSVARPFPGRRTRPSAVRRRRPALAAKRALDLVGAATALVVLAPILVAIAIAVRATLGRPILFRQVRPGLHGRPFTIRKFRTMRPPRGDEVFWATDEARITNLGRVLRSTSLDELPELWNVLRGEMSLVGPRPLLTEYLVTYTPEQARRHDVRPGITSWAAVNGRHASRFEERLALDTWYVDHWSLALDLRILARTVVQVLRRTDVSATQDLDAVGFPLPGVRTPGTR